MLRELVSLGVLIVGALMIGAVGLSEVDADAGRIASVQHATETTVLIRDAQTGTFGAGVILTATGVVLTANHVVSGMVEPTVSLFDGREFPMVVIRTPGTSVGPDLALVGIQSDVAVGVGVSPLGCDSDVQAGDFIYTVGHPSVGLQFSSSYGRVARTEIGGLDSLLQVDLSVVGGNSGGGLFNVTGEIIGLVRSRSIIANVFGLEVPTSIAWAIPIKTICAFIQKVPTS